MSYVSQIHTFNNGHLYDIFTLIDKNEITLMV